MDKRLLTIQDISCVGQCSLTVALPVISACGIETAILPSSVLSNHTAPGFSAWTFNDLTDDMPNILAQWKKENITFDGHDRNFLDCGYEDAKRLLKEAGFTEHYVLKEEGFVAIPLED